MINQLINSFIFHLQLLVEFHNSEPASSETPPPSPSTGVRVSVIKHTKDEQAGSEEAGRRSERSWENAREKYPDFSSFCSLEERTPPTESCYTQRQEIFVKCKNTDRESTERASPLSISPKASSNNLNQAMQRPVILPKMTIGTNVFHQPPSVTREKSFICSYVGCEKSYYKLSHLKAHYRVHTGRY